MPEAGNRNEQIVRTFFEALSSGDMEGLRPLFHEEATWTGMVTGLPGAGEKNGRKEIIDEFLAPVRGMFVDGDPKVLIQHLILQGPYAAVEARGVGRLKSGKEYNNRYAFMIEIKDDKIFALREYMDSYYVSTL
jgi:hypothetical protein